MHRDLRHHVLWAMASWCILSSEVMHCEIWHVSWAITCVMSCDIMYCNLWHHVPWDLELCTMRFDIMHRELRHLVPWAVTSCIVSCGIMNRELWHHVSWAVTSWSVSIGIMSYLTSGLTSTPSIARRHKHDLHVRSEYDPHPPCMWGVNMAPTHHACEEWIWPPPTMHVRSKYGPHPPCMWGVNMAPTHHEIWTVH